jgi:hypothetical protein
LILACVNCFQRKARPPKEEEQRREGAFCSGKEDGIRLGLRSTTHASRSSTALDLDPSHGRRESRVGRAMAEPPHELPDDIVANFKKMFQDKPTVRNSTEHHF